MTLLELIDKAGLKPMSKFENRPVEGVYISDMVSDVMAGAKSGDLWLTIQTHKSIVPAANLVDVSAIVITGGKEVPAETLEFAGKYGIAILSSALPTFPLVGRLYELGVRGRQ